MNIQILAAVASYRKSLGKVELWQDRLIFQSDEDKSLNVELMTSDIKSQFVNPATSSKALLRITLNSSEEPALFQFLGEDPHKERDLFKDSLAECMTALRTGQPLPTMPSTQSAGLIDRKRPSLSADQIRARQELLKKDTKLARLHKDLVRGGILDEEDFWQPRLHLLESQLMENTQNAGLPSEMKHGILPSSTEGAEVKYTLTPQDIQSIFLHYPALKRAFDSNVPSVLDEKEFWTRCLQSKFFFRDRSLTGKAKKDAIFDKAAEEEELDLHQSHLGKRPNNFLLDLEESEQTDEYQPELDNTMKFAKSSLSLPLIRRFNRHGDLVVKAFQPQENGGGRGQEARHKQILREVMKIEDLMPPKEDVPVMLNINSGGSFVGVTAVSKDNLINETVKRKVIEMGQRLKSSLNATVLPPTKAHKCIETVDKFTSARKHSATDKASVDQEVMSINLAASEVLVHFWNCVQASDRPENQQKLVRINKALASLLSKMESMSVRQPSPLASLKTSLKTALNYQTARV